MFTFLAIAFVVLLVVAVFYGFSIVVRRPPTKEELASETCTLCRLKFNKSELVERQVGDSRLYYFCHSCIERLHDEVQQSQKPRG
jgi:hypothetical protein